jgi:DNA polymerase III subunit alpha, Gram-positive type
MTPYPNLISDSLLINETIQLLQSFGGRAHVTDIVDTIMEIDASQTDFARQLVSDMVGNDPRLQLNEDTLELIAINHDARKLFETDFVVFDLETTGAKTPPCRITEIGAYRISRGKIIGEFETLVNPECLIPPFISDLTGISNSMVRRAPKFCDVANDFLDFIGDAVLVAHNAHFDMRFLNYEIGRIYDGYRLGNPSLCTVQLSRKLLPHIANHRLHTVADYYSIIIENRHRAGGDAHATAKIFVNLLSQLENLGVRDLATAKKFKL